MLSIAQVHCEDEGTRKQIHTAVELAKATAKGFEPSRAEPIGFRDQLLNHSDTLSVVRAITAL